MSGSPTLIAVCLAYFALMVAIGLWAARRTHSAEDYFVAGRGLGLWPLALATMASAMSGFAFIGGPGAQFQFGFGSLLLTFPAAVSFGLAWYLLGTRLHALAARQPLMTLPDVLNARYQSRAVQGLGTLALLLGVLGYLATQTLAMGVVFAALFGLPLVAGIWIGVAVVAAYAVAGGMIAGIWTDVVQGLLMAGVAVLVGALALEVGGGLGPMLRGIAERGGADWVGPFGTLAPGVVIGWYLVFSLGILGQPQVAHKFLMLRAKADLRWGAVIAAAAAMLTSLVWLSLGTVSRFLAGEGLLKVPTPDEAAPRFLMAHAPALLTGLFFAGVAAASMSTADSFLNIGAAALVRDLPATLGRAASAETQLRWGRWLTLALAALAGALAQASGELVAVLGIFGWGLFAAALAPALGLGLCWPRAGAPAALASMATGLILQLGLELNARFGFWPGLLPEGVYRAAVALAASFIVFIAVGFLAPAQKSGGKGSPSANGSRASGVSTPSVIQQASQPGTS